MTIRGAKQDDVRARYRVGARRETIVGVAAECTIRQQREHGNDDEREHARIHGHTRLVKRARALKQHTALMASC